MKLRLQKRIASKLLGRSKKKIRLDVEKLSEIKEAITRSDIRKLIGEGAITKKPKKIGVSRGRARKRILQKRKSRRKGRGSKKGTATATLSRKERWVNRIRAQRKILKDLKNEKKLSTSNYEMLRKKAKGGFFRSKRHLTLFINEKNLLMKS